MPTGIYKRTEEHKKKISEGHKGILFSGETKRKMSESNTGKKYPNRKSPPPFTEEVKKKLSEAKKGKILSEEHKRKLSEVQKGSKSNNWRGGISFEPYSVDWTETLKKSIRQRDRYTCQLCGEEPSIYIHHIDYNKKNCHPDNLITLCHSCHCKTNFNRDYWTEYFKKL